MVAVAGDVGVDEGLDAEGVDVGGVAILGDGDTTESLEARKCPTLNGGGVALAGHVDSAELLQGREGAQLEGNFVVALAHDVMVKQRQAFGDGHIVAILGDGGFGPVTQLAFNFHAVEFLGNHGTVESPVGNHTQVESGIQKEAIA